jgi:hypothetical protein
MDILLLKIHVNDWQTYRQLAISAEIQLFSDPQVC